MIILWKRFKRIIDGLCLTLMKVPELTELYGEEFEKRYIELESDESVAKR